MDVFEQAAVRGFERRTIDHLKEYFPKSCEILGERRLREIIRLGWDKAKGYGVTAESGVRLYVSLMFMLGSHFDADPQLPWAAEILADPEVSDEVERINGLYERAMAYLEEVAGAKNEHLDAALQKVRQAKMASLPEPSSPDFYRHVLARLAEIFPQKFRHVGELNARRLIQRGVESAGSYGLTEARGAAIYTGLMFMLGAGFDKDPQFPWAATVLNDESVDHKGQKVERLYGEALAYLDRWAG